MSNNEHMEEQASLQALGLLDDESRLKLLEDVARDPAIAHVVDEYVETAALLSLEIPPIAPPSELKEAVMSQLPARHDSQKIIFPSWIIYAMAACLLISAVLLAATLHVLKTKVAVENAELVRLRKSDALIGLKLTQLEIKDASYQASRIIVAWDPNQNRGVISMSNLPAPAPGHNYQLWVLDPGAQAPISAGLIHPEAGSGTFKVPSVTTGSPGFAITLEPGQGSPMPTSAILFAVAPAQ